MLVLQNSMSVLRRVPQNIVVLLPVILLAALIGISSAIDPTTVWGVTSSGLVGIVFATALYRFEKHRMGSPWWGQIIVAGLLLRFLMGFAHLAVGLIFYKGAVDFVGYQVHAVDVARGLVQGRLEHVQDFLIGNTGTFTAKYLTSLFYFITGPSLLGMVMMAAIVGFLGSYLFIRAFQMAFPLNRNDRFLPFAILFLPSLAFWGILLGKDSWMFLFLGWVTYGVACYLRKPRFRHLLGIAVGIAGVSMLRLTVGGAVILAFGLAWCLNLPRKGLGAILRPIWLAVSVTVIVGIALSVGSTAVKRYKAEQLSLESVIGAAVYVHEGLSRDPGAGGSSLPIRIPEPSLGAVLWYLPEGISTFLFRPVIFEAHHGLALAAALESTFFLLLVIWQRRNLVAAIKSMLRNPFVGFCAVTFFILTVILAFEANFGAIVRHRAMVLPFMLILMATPYNKSHTDRR